MQASRKTQHNMLCFIGKPLGELLVFTTACDFIGREVEDTVYSSADATIVIVVEEGGDLWVGSKGGYIIVL